MKLRRLAIERLPGVEGPFELEDLSDGLNVIVGPNGIGKSRISAAVRSLLWPDRGVKDGGLVASAIFEHDSVRWRVSRDGSAIAWQRDGIDAEPPELPGGRLDGCFFLGLRDLLDDSDLAGQDLASQIRRQMSGGFDLDAVKAGFEKSLPKRAGAKEIKALSAAENEIRKAERNQEEISRQEEELESMNASATRAEAALHRLRHYETALSRLALRADLAQCETDLAELPGSLENLDGKELDRLEKLDEELIQKSRDRDDAEDALGVGQFRALETRLKEAIDGASLEAWRQRAEKLGELEHFKEAAAVDAGVARKAATASRKPLGALSEPDVGSDLGSEVVSDVADALVIEDDSELFVFLRESHQLTTEHIALEERLNLLSTRQFAEDQERRLKLLKRGIDPLRDWLRSPDPALPTGGAMLWPSRNTFLLSGIVLVAVGLSSLLKPEFLPWGIGVGGVGIGLVAAGLVFRLQATRDQTTDWRSIAQQRFPETLESPSRWSTDAVANLLDQLEDELAKLDADRMRARDRAVESGVLKESLNSLEERADALEARRRKLADRLALDGLRSDAELVDLARALDVSRAANVESSRAAEKLGKLEEDHRQALDEVSVYLVGLGEGEATDAASARAGVQSIEARNRTLRSANEEAVREQKSLDRIGRDIEKLEADRSGIYRIAGVTGDITANSRAELTRLLGALTQYRELKTQRSDLATRIARAESDLDAAQERALAQLDVSELEQQQVSLKRDSEDRASLNRKIGEITQRVRSAREGHELEDAIAQKSAVLSELRDRRDEALTAAAGSFLVDGVRHEHETNQMPRVLERARDRFAIFTHQRYELVVSTSGGGTFVAVDSKSRTGLTLDRLSDGTRAQLVLAARLAFAEEAEHGADLPLFLDEALDYSDPERFHSIACSLARMVADDGRQVFYLSNDPTDAERFQSAFSEEGCDQLKTLDLGVIRGQAARVDGPDALRVLPLAVVPSPSGQSAESYGATLGVSRLDPSQSPFSQHIYYVLRDDLALLYVLLEARVETVGQCRNLLKGSSDLAKTIVAGGAEGSGTGEQLEARIELLETFSQAWCEGRGKKVGRLDIEASGAVTPPYLDGVVDVAADLDGDAERLLGALRDRKDPRLSGYRSKAADDLGRFFLERGHTDDRPILDESTLVERAIGTPAANRISPRVAAELVHQWWSLANASIAPVEPNRES